MNASDKLLSRDQVAECLGASISTVVRLEKRGELPRVKLGRLVRFRPDDVDALIEQASKSDTTPPPNGVASNSRPVETAGHEPS
jgi:excisionase family DNA binding protein